MKSNNSNTDTRTKAISWIHSLGLDTQSRIIAKYYPMRLDVYSLTGREIEIMYKAEHPSTAIPEQANAKWYLIPTSFKPIGELREVIIAEMEVTADLTKGREFDSPTSLFLRGENDRLKIENEALKERVKELEKQVKPKIYY